jgi:PAS domain S-box-containing protein
MLHDAVRESLEKRWRVAAIRRAVIIAASVIIVLVPTVIADFHSPVGLVLLPLVGLYLFVLRIAQTNWRAARLWLVVVTHLLGVALVLLFGYRGQTNLLWLGTIPLMYVLYDDDEQRARGLALSIPMAGFVATEVTGRLGVLPQLLPGDTAHYSALSVAVMFMMLVQRTQALSAFSFSVRKSLEDEHVRMEQAQAATHVGSFECDIASGNMLWSRELYRIHGLSPDTSLTMGAALAMIHADDRAAVVEQIRSLLDRRAQSGEREYRIVREGGEVRTLRWSLQANGDGVGRTVRITGTVEDITARRAYEDALVRAREEALQASQAKSAFLANMSHELRTPMNGVLGMTTLALETDLDARQREYLDAALGSGRALLAVLNDVLDLSKIEAGRLSVESVSFSLETVAVQVIELVRPSAAQRGLRVDLHVRPGLARRHLGDPVRLRQVLTNLLANGVKFTERGSVRLVVEPSEDGTRVIFEVTDTGVGIPASRRSAIFEAFTQADGSITRRFGGTGLGLTIVRELVRLMEGTISVTSEEGQGSIFRVELPLEEAEADAARAHPSVIPHEPATTRPLRVLLVEDNAVNARIALALVRRAGHDVTHVTDGSLAVDAVAREHFDLVLMDVQMPVMDGLEATRQLRARERGTRDHVPIVAMTANAMKGDDELCFRAGMDGYLPKPLEFARLREVLSRYAASEAPPRMAESA